MTLFEIIGSGGLSLFIIMSLIQISPIKFNPWSAIGKAIGNAINGDIIAKVEELSKDVKRLSDSYDEREAISMRNRILRFNDELYYDDHHHSKESFDSIMHDISAYNRYCNNHPDFENRMTTIASKNIENTYKKCWENHSFI